MRIRVTVQYVIDATVSGDDVTDADRKRIASRLSNVTLAEEMVLDDVLDATDADAGDVWDGPTVVSIERLVEVPESQT